MTPEEFAAISKAYSDQREAEYKDRWERTRAIVVAAVRPYIKGKPTAKKIYPLPWDTETTKKGRPTPKISAEESKARFEKLAKRFSGGSLEDK